MASFDTTSLFLSLIFSSIGFGYFIYGKRQANYIAKLTGIALMIYPYLVSSNMAMVLVGIALMFIPKFMKP